MFSTLRIFKANIGKQLNSTYVVTEKNQLKLIQNVSFLIMRFRFGSLCKKKMNSLIKIAQLDILQPTFY